MTRLQAGGAFGARGAWTALAGALVAAAMMAGPASAAIIHRTYEFTAGGFGAGAPVDPVTGSFTVKFDNSASIVDASSGLTVNAFNLSVAPLVYTYVNAVDSLIIGGANGGANSFDSAGDFWIQLFGVSGDNTRVAGVYYTTAGASFFSTKLWRSGGASVVSAPVPEPATWIMMICGLGFAGGALRRRVAPA